MRNVMDKVLKFFIINKEVQEKNKNTLLKVLVKYLAIWIGACILTSVFCKVPLIKNLFYNVKTILGWYTLAGIGLAILQYLGKIDMSETVECYTFYDLKKFFEAHQTKQNRIIMIAVIVVLCLIPRGASAKENKTVESDVVTATDKEIEKEDISEYIEEQNEKADEDKDNLMDEYLAETETTDAVEEAANVEIELSEDVNLGEAVWVDTPYEPEPGLHVQYNSAMLNMGYCDKAYGNVVYLDGVALGLPMKVSDYFKVTGKDSLSSDDQQAISFKTICVSEDQSSWDNWYIYGIQIYIADGGWLFDDGEYFEDKLTTKKVVLPGGLVVNDNIDLTIHYALNEKPEEERPYNNVILRRYVKEEMGQYEVEFSEYNVPRLVTYELDFIRDGVSSEYGTQYDAALASFVEPENYQEEIDGLREESLLYGTSSEQYGNIIKINGIDVRFPILLKDFKDLGFEIYEDEMKETYPTAVVETDGKVKLKVKSLSEDDKWTIYVEGFNPADITVRLEDVILRTITIENIEGEPKDEIVLPGNIVMGENMKSILQSNLDDYSWSKSGFDNCKYADYDLGDTKFSYKVFVSSKEYWDHYINALR